MTTALHAIAIKALSCPGHRFQNLYGLLKSDLLYKSWGQLNKQSAPGIDGVTIPVYRERLSENINHLSRQVKDRDYRAAKVKRVYIPKANGKLRPLGLPTIADKVVQQSVAQILESIWEADFLPCSYGYRPNCSAHHAIQTLNQNLQYGGYRYIVEADIKGFFDNMSHEWLLRMLRLRIDDAALLKLIQQWLKARVQEPDGKLKKPLCGTPQGGVISPILANIYLHYALDLWFEKIVKPKLAGNAILVRYADDFVVAFHNEEDAQHFYHALPSRLEKFNLELSLEKTHLKSFRWYKDGENVSFQFLGFKFYRTRDAKGKPTFRRHTAPKKEGAAIRELYGWIKRNRVVKLRELMPVLKRKLLGFRNYFGLTDNSRSIGRVYRHTVRALHKWLNRRSQKRSMNWQGLRDLLKYFRIDPPRVRKCQIRVKVEGFRVLHGQRYN